MLLFKLRFVDGIRDGSKDVTRRWWKRPRVKVGSIHDAKLNYTARPFARIRILSCDEADPNVISTPEARREGFNSIEEFMCAFAAINGSRDLTGRQCYRVAFELVKEA